MKKAIVIFIILFSLFFNVIQYINNNTMYYYKEQNRNEIVKLKTQKESTEKELKDIIVFYKKTQDELEKYKQYNQIQKERIELIEKQNCYPQWQMKCDRELKTIRELWDRINKDTEECAMIQSAFGDCNDIVLNIHNPNY